MGTFLAGLGEQAASDAVGGIFGMALSHFNDQRQVHQQQKLTDMQLEANKSMANYNSDLNYQMWLKTNYPAQMEQLKKAGLNPALLYGGGGGAGGSTQGGGGGNVSAPNAPAGGGEAMGMMMQTLQAQMIKSQVDLNKTQAAKNEAEAANTIADTANKPLTGENIKASTQNLTQSAQTQKEQQSLLQAQTQMQNLQNDITSASKENIIATTQTGLLKIDQELQQMVRNNSIGNSTYKDVIKTVQANAINAILQNQQIQQSIKESNSRIQLNDAEIRNLTEQIQTKWAEIMQNNDRVLNELDKTRQEKFIHDLDDQTKLGIETITKIVQGLTIGEGLSGKPMKPF